MTYVDPVLLKNESSSSDLKSTSSISEVNNSNIWSEILQEVQDSTKNSPPPKSIILLGDNESGRSTLISRLKGVENISKGVGLEYHYVEVKDEERDDVPKLGVWIPDGDGSCGGVLKIALNESNFENTLIVFVVSMSSPWSIMDSLKKWSTIIREHVRKLSISEEKRNEFMKRQERSFQIYQDPDETVNLHNKKSTTTNTSSTSKSTRGEVDTSKQEKDESLLPLDPSVLSQNLGLPVIVVLTKSDYISILDKESEFRIEHFDFIQFHIRKFCLDYGAALFYTTVKDKRTFERLYKYLLHKIYEYPFSLPASVIDRESVFIPSGWDNESKINILLENSATIKSDSDFAEIIPKPSMQRKPVQRDVETINAVEDQEFLSKLQILLNKTSSTTPKAEDLSTIQQVNVSSNQPVLKTPHKPAQMKNMPADSTNLKNFFQNLLSKNAPSATNAASGQSQPTDQPANQQGNPSPSNVKPEN